MSSFFKGIETSITITTDIAYQQLEYYWGKELELWRPDKNDVYSKVHNKEANNALKKIKVFVGVTQIDNLSVTDTYNQANLQEGFLITQETEILVGDVIIFIGDGGKARFKVEKHLDLGFESTMFTKYSISSMN